MDTTIIMALCGLFILGLLVGRATKRAPSMPRPPAAEIKVKKSKRGLWRWQAVIDGELWALQPINIKFETSDEAFAHARKGLPAHPPGAGL